MCVGPMAQAAQPVKRLRSHSVSLGRSAARKPPNCGAAVSVWVGLTEAGLSVSLGEGAASVDKDSCHDGPGDSWPLADRRSGPRMAPDRRHHALWVPAARSGSRL